jgi:hypothetical protein
LRSREGSRHDADYGISFAVAAVCGAGFLYFDRAPKAIGKIPLARRLTCRPARPIQAAEKTFRFCTRITLADLQDFAQDLISSGLAPIPECGRWLP